MVVIISESLVRLGVCVPFESVVVEAGKIERADFPLLGTVFLLTFDQVWSDLPRCRMLIPLIVPLNNQLH